MDSLARIFHRGDGKQRPAAGAWACGMPRQLLGGPCKAGRAARRPLLRCDGRL